MLYSFILINHEFNFFKINIILFTVYGENGLWVPGYFNHLKKDWQVACSACMAWFTCSYKAIFEYVTFLNANLVTFKDLTNNPKLERWINFRMPRSDIIQLYAVRVFSVVLCLCLESQSAAAVSEPYVLLGSQSASVDLTRLQPVQPIASLDFISCLQS